MPLGIPEVSLARLLPLGIPERLRRARALWGF